MEYRVPAQAAELVGTSELYPVNSVTVLSSKQ